MNHKRREKLRVALASLDTVYLAVEAVCYQEEDCMDNYPENLQATDQYEKMEDAVDYLNDALEKIDEAKALIESAAQ